MARALTMHAHCSSTHVMTKLTSIGCFAYHRATICGRDGAKRFDGVLRERERERTLIVRRERERDTTLIERERERTLIVTGAVGHIAVI